MKPSLHINVGQPYSGTKPFAYSLNKSHYKKRRFYTEPNILYYLFLLDADPIKANEYFDSMNQNFEKDVTLGDYISNVKSSGGYLDFSNSNSSISLDYLLKIAPILQEEFDVRVTMIWRDPIDRSYSHASDEYSKYALGKSKGTTWEKFSTRNKHENFKFYAHWRMIRKKFPTSIRYWKSQLEGNNQKVTPSYARIYHTWAKAFTHVMPVIMEDLWYGHSNQLERLEEFVGYPVGILYDNGYTSGHVTEGHQKSDLQILTDSDREYAFERMQWVYQEYETVCGPRPSTWYTSGVRA